jgi:DNA-binding response OmpR family regulator
VNWCCAVARPCVRLYTGAWHNRCVRIRVVEDEASLRDGIVDLLTGDGHQLVAVGDGVAGVEAGLRDPFELVVLDLMLPRLDGEVGIVRWLHRHRDRVVTRAELLEQVFGQRGDLQTRAVDMAIAVLRKKLEADPARPTVIISVKGAGYAWRLAR